jgi:hypothetical protein
MHGDHMQYVGDPLLAPPCNETVTTSGDERAFAEFRRKVRESEMLSGSMMRLLQRVRFSGRLSVVVQNGRVLKSGYEEGYFTRKKDQRLVP